MISFEKTDFGNSVAIFGGAGVDPDGLACVEAMATIVKHISPETDVAKYYRGTFDRPQNRTMREVLSLEQTPIEEYVNGVALNISVDGPASVCPVTPDYIIDHHPKEGKTAARKEDIRTSNGSCSSIMWEYLVAHSVPISKELATALAIGICTDTEEKCTETTSELDWEAEAALGKLLDPTLYNTIKNYPKPEYYGEMSCYAWGHRTMEGTCWIAELGEITKERTGVISTIAVELSAFAGVETAVVVAMVNGDFVLCMRSTDPSVSVHGICSTIGDGGGRRGAGKSTIRMPLKGEGLFDAGYKIICDQILREIGDGKRK